MKKLLTILLVYLKYPIAIAWAGINTADSVLLCTTPRQMFFGSVVVAARALYPIAVFTMLFSLVTKYGRGIEVIISSCLCFVVWVKIKTAKTAQSNASDADNKRRRSENLFSSINNMFYTNISI